jgi:hypothetical protein
VGRAPGGSAGVAAIGPASERFEAKRGIFESAEGICTCPGEIPDGFICHRGDIDHREITRAGQSGQWHGVSAVGVDPIAWWVGAQRRCHHPAVVAFFCQIALEPGATGTGFVDEDQLWGLRWHVADELSAVTLAGAKSSERGDLSTMILSHRGDRHRVLVDIHADVQCARLVHG